MAEQLRKDTGTGKARVFIVDDHPVVRQGLAQYINDEHDLIVCGEAEDVNGAIVQIGDQQPDIVIADITLRDGNGLDLTAAIKDRFNIPVLVLSMYEEDFYAERALRAGARGYVMKKEPMATVITAIREILTGKIHLGEAVKDRLLDRMLAGHDRTGHPVEALSNREVEILKMIGDGMGNRQIAASLGLSVKTIETYRTRIIEKLRLDGSSELTRYAIEWRKGDGKNL